jgi:hypothetical protein
MSKLQIGRAGRPWIRGVAVLAVLGALTVAAISSPVGAAGTLTRKQVKKIATRQIKKLAPTLNVATAKSLANVTVQREDFTVVDNSGNGGTATCPAGQQALAGGVVSGANDTYVTHSGPSKGTSISLTDGQTFDGWFGFVFNQPASSGDHPMTVYVVCAG